jgi:hypothetical protein
MNWIKSKIVILPTKDESCVLKNKYIMAGNQILPYSEMQKLHSEGTDAELELRGFEHQHLYFTSDEEIKEGEHCIVDGGNGRIGVDIFYSHVKYSVTPKKIIATTDPKFIYSEIFEGYYIEDNRIVATPKANKMLPQPSQDFIKEYCDAGGIDEVMIEMEDKGIVQTGRGGKRNINIRKIKDSWSREEVKELMQKSWYEAEVSTSRRLSTTVTFDRSGCIKWIEKNL